MTQARIPPADVASSRALWREAAVTSLAWLVVGGVASVLRVIASTLNGRPDTLATAAADASLIAMWALATPFVLRSARRFPVRPPRARANAAVHLATGTAFIALTNVLIRVGILADHGFAAFARNLALGLATYFPTAIVSYSVLVALGHRFFAPPLESPVEPDEPEANRLVIREWNRVHLIEVSDIEWVEADNNHVVVHAAVRTYKGRERLSDVESRLDGYGFLRVHRSALVCLSKIREVQPLMRGDQAVIMRSGRVVRVARGRRQALADALGVPL